MKICTQPGRVNLLQYLKPKQQLGFKTQGSTEFIAQRPWAVAIEQSEDTTIGLRAITFIVYCLTFWTIYMHMFLYLLVVILFDEHW